MACKISIYDIVQLTQESWRDRKLIFPPTVDLRNSIFNYRVLRYNRLISSSDILAINNEVVLTEPILKTEGNYTHELVWNYGTEKYIVFQGQIIYTSNADTKSICSHDTDVNVNTGNEVINVTIDNVVGGVGLTPEQEQQLSDINNKVDKENGKGLSTNDFIPDGTTIVIGEDGKASAVVNETSAPDVIELISIDLVGYYYNTGSANTTTSTFRRSDYILVKKGQKVQYGLNSTTNSSSTGAIIVVTRSNVSPFTVILNIPAKDNLSKFYEGEYVATEDCYVALSNNNANTWGTPYARLITPGSSSSEYLTPDSIGDTVASQEDLETLENKVNNISVKDNSISFVGEGKKIVISGTSFSYSANGWFELMCSKLGVTGVNQSYSGERIDNFSARILNGTFFTQSVLNDCDALMIMHSHNKDVYTLGDITVNGNVITGATLNNYTVAQYEALNWDRLTNTTAGWDGSDAEFAAVWDYVLKKIQTIYFNEKNNSASSYFEQKGGKPFNVVLTTSWHDNRAKFNDSIRKLANKWGLPLIRFDDNVGFSKEKLHISGVQPSILHAMLKSDGVTPDTEVINGVTYAWHQERGPDKYIQKRMASIAKKTFEII